MKWCVALLCWMTLDVHAGMQRQSPPTTAAVTDATKRAYDKDGDVDLEPLLDLKIGDSVAFKIGDEIVVGTVNQRDVSPGTGLKIFGTFPGHDKAGFLFQFGVANTVKGLLFFVGRNATYNLVIDEATKRLSFERRDLQPRAVPPAGNASVTK